MEKFALLDFLKAFGSLTANGKTGNEPDNPPATPAPAPMPAYERNPMADVIARHEEISNRIKNRR